MAAIPTWQEHWRIPFMSMDGILYTISIYEWNYQGSVVTLKGAPDPFITQEDASDNIFTNIRVQSGYINIILDPASTPAEAEYLEAIAPKNNTEKLVHLKHNEGNAVVIDWQGFLQAQMFDQPWNQTARMIELPVKSLLACLEDIDIPATAMDSNLSPIAKIFTAAYLNLMREDTAPYDNFIFIDDATGWTFMRYYLQISAFFSLVTINNEGESDTMPVGMSWMEALNGIFKTFGVTVREAGRNIVFAKMDVPAPRTTTLTWAQIQLLAAGSTDFTIAWENLPAAKSISDDNLTWKGSDIRQGSKLGARSWELNLNLSSGVALSIKLPTTELDQSATIELGSDYIVSGTVFGQIHSPRSNGYETFTYMKRVSFTEKTFEEATYQECVDNCIFNMPTFNPNNIPTPVPLITGAIPVRWEKVEPDEQAKGMVSGLLLNLNSYGIPGSYVGDRVPVYGIKSFFGFTLNAGFIKIDGIINSFWRTSTDGKLDFIDDVTQSESTFDMIYFYMTLQIGNKKWNGNTWVQESSSTLTPYFRIPFLAGKVESNASTIVGDASLSGFYIPIPSDGLEGFVTLQILNRIESYQSGVSPDKDLHASIVEDLEVTHYIPPTPNQSTRRENTYYRSQDTGFKNTIREQLVVGTRNNNPDSVLLIRATGNPSNYLESIAYNGIGLMRPENNLLQRMATYYNISRQWLQAVVSDSGLDLLKTLWTYRGKNFYAIEQTHRWWDSNITIKFIETKDITES